MPSQHNPLPKASEGYYQLLGSLSDLNTLVNALIGIAVTFIVLTVLVNALRWVLAEEEGENKKARAGFIRSFLALFFSVNVWWLIWTIDQFMALTPMVAYVTFAFMISLFVFWSVFSFGDTLLYFLRRAAYASVVFVGSVTRVDVSFSHLRERMSAPVAKGLTIAVVGLALSVMFVYGTGTFNQGASIEEETSGPEVGSVEYKLLLPGNAYLEGNTYVDTRYGLSVTFPEGWAARVAGNAGDPYALAHAENREKGFSVVLKGSDVRIAGSEEKPDFWSVVWDVKYNIVQGAGRDLVRAEFGDYEPQAAGSETAIVHTIERHVFPDGAEREYGYYDFIFSRDEVYYMLTFVVPVGSLDEDIIATIDKTIRSVQFSNTYE